MSRRRGFGQFIRKVEGNDTVCETKGVEPWHYTRYPLIYSLARGFIGWKQYCERVYDLNFAERQAHLEERNRLGIRGGFDCAVGSDNALRVRLIEDREPTACNPISEQQANVESEAVSGGTRPDYGYILESIFPPTYLNRTSSAPAYEAYTREALRDRNLRDYVERTYTNPPVRSGMVPFDNDF